MASSKLWKGFFPALRFTFGRSLATAVTPRQSGALIWLKPYAGQRVILCSSNKCWALQVPTQVHLLSTCKPLYRKVGGDLPHFNKDSSVQDADVQEEKRTKSSYVLPHPIWCPEDLHNVQITHKKPENWVDEMAFITVQILRILFDIFSMYKIGRMSEDKWLTRIIMLETLAGVPGMVGAMVRHFNSLRRMTRDHGWIHTLLEDAENERMHLMVYLELKNPGRLFRFSVILAQGVMVNLLFLAYLISPKFVHRFVGYLEEEAVKTYTFCLECLDKGHLPMWKHLKAPEIAKNYWKLGDNAMMRDVILATRADEAHHRLVNHTLASMPYDKQNPFMPGQKKL